MLSYFWRRYLFVFLHSERKQTWVKCLNTRKTYCSNFRRNYTHIQKQLFLRCRIAHSYHLLLLFLTTSLNNENTQWNNKKHYCLQIYVYGHLMTCPIKFSTSYRLKYLRHTMLKLCDQCCRGKGIDISYSGCVYVTLVIQHTKRIHRLILYLMTFHCLTCFSTLSHKRHYFRGKVTEHKICVLISS
jgi:hypothetical protein